MPLRVLIVDDHSVARDAIREAVRLCRAPTPEIVGEAVDGATAIDLARRLLPDVITMDIGLPDISGLEVTRMLAAEMPDTRTVVVSAHDDRWYREAAAGVGAVGYVAKNDLARELPNWLDQLASPRPAPAVTPGT